MPELFGELGVVKHFRMESEQSCPGCGASVDCNGSVDHDSPPQPGDVSVCSACGEILQFGEGLKVEKIDLAELEDTRLHQPADYATLMKLQQEFRRRRTGRRRHRAHFN